MSAAIVPEDRKSIGSYDLLEKIAVGGMGAVYKARHQNTGQIVAVKIVPPHLTKNEILLKRFKQEFRVARNLHHPHVVQAVEFGHEGGSYYLAMEYVEGETLGERIERHGRIVEADAIRILVQAAHALHAAHQQGLIHRDVKPDNILITSADVAKLADLGLAKDVQADAGLTRTGRGLGTPHFMSPEQFRDAKRVGVRSDIYSLGATLYMAVTGELPFRAMNPWEAWKKKVNNDLPAPRAVVPAVSERIDWAIRRAMSADPEKRPASCLEFIEDITGERPPTVSPQGKPDASKWWYLYYQDQDGQTKTVKGTVEAVRLALKDSQLGSTDGIRAARSKAGPFEPLRNYPEFRDLLISPAALESAIAKIDPDKTEPLEALSASKITLTPISSNSSNFPVIRINDSSETLRPLSSDTHRALPKIDLVTKKKDSIGWVTWVLVAIGAAAASAVLTLYLTGRF